MHNLNSIIDFITNKLFDLRYGVETEKQVMTYDLLVNTISVKHAKRYQASHIRLLSKTFKRLEIDFRDYSFVDIGAGKGRAMMMASLCGFRKVIGVEFAENLASICRQNLSRFKVRDSEFDLLECDVLDMSPVDERSVYFFFNPFDKVMIQKLIDQTLLKSSTFEEDIVISLNPRSEFLFILAGYEKFDEIMHSNWNRRVHFYRYKGISI